MKLLTSIALLYLAVVSSIAQTGSVRLGSEINNGIMTNGCAGPCQGTSTDPDFICSDQADNNGNHLPETMTHDIIVPAGNYMQLTVLTNECNAGTDGLDSGDSFSVNGNEVVTGSGNTRVDYSGCFVNFGTADLTIPLTLIANRRDETVTATWTFSSTNPGGDCASAMPLPVQLSHFNAEAKSGTTTISFTTATEVNNDYFTISRSADGKIFENIGEVDGSGNSHQEVHYEFVDEKPIAGISYYRIMQTDYDGQYSYSDVKSVRHNGWSNLSVTPSTTAGNLYVTTDMDNYSINIFTAAGQPVKSFSSLSLDQNINIEELQPGVYYVMVNSSLDRETIKIVKI